MRAINPFLVLDIDESAPRAEIEAAHRRLIVANHPDRFASASVEEQARAAARTAELNEAHLLLTDAEYAARHKRKIDRVRAAGIVVEPAPRRADPDRGPARGVDGGGTDYRQAAGREFTVPEERRARPWAARRRKRFGRR